MKTTTKIWLAAGIFLLFILSSCAKTLYDSCEWDAKKKRGAGLEPVCEAWK